MLKNIISKITSKIIIGAIVGAAVGGTTPIAIWAIRRAQKNNQQSATSDEAEVADCEITETPEDIEEILNEAEEILAAETPVAEIPAAETPAAETPAALKT